jgi:hypothetical protein
MVMHGCCRGRPLAAGRSHFWLRGILVALIGLPLITSADAGKNSGSKNNPPPPPPPPPKQSTQQPVKPVTKQQADKNNNDDDDDGPGKGGKLTTKQQANKSNKQDDDDDDAKGDPGKGGKPATKQQANKNNKQDDDDDDADGSNGKNDPSTVRSTRATSIVKPQDTPPPDNLVDWWRWVTKPAAPGPVARSRAQPLEVTSTPGIARAAPAPAQKPRPAESKAPEAMAEVAARREVETPMRVGASPPHLEPDGKRQAKPSDETAKLSDEKAKSPHEKATKKDAPATIKSWASRLPPPEGTYRAQEVLGFNLTPAAHERLRQLGYTPKPSTASGLTQIILPEGLDPWTAQRRLEAEFQQGFALNFLYDHYRNELDSAPITGVVPVSGSEGCTTERCYGRKVIGWKDQIGACAKGVKIGVIDTGYDAGHPAFANLKATVVMEDEASRSPDWHGTGVLSLLGGAAKSSTPGLVPEAEFLIADAFYKTTFGRARTDSARLLEALRRLEKHGAQVINMSLVGPSDELVHAQIADMSARKGVVFVAAAGNGGPAAPPGYPAAYKEVIAVTAIDDKKRSYDYANRGPYIDVAAPGVRIWTAQPSNMEGMLNGTSFAAPFVTGIAAAAYNSTPLRAQLREGRLPLDPKGAMLAAFNIEKLGSGGRNDQYGLGLVKAPSSCGPAVAPPVAGVTKPPPPAAAAPTQSWQGDITRAAYQ